MSLFLREQHFKFSNGWLSSSESGFEGFHPFDFIESFAGSANLSKELLRKFHGCAFDILFEEGHDALSSGGLKLFILALCLTTEQALVWIATQPNVHDLCLYVFPNLNEKHRITGWETSLVISF